MKKQRVVLIVNCYNSDTFIEETLNSLIKQDHPEVKILIVDNLSTDKTLEIIKNYQHFNKNIILHRLKKHVPLVEARIKALAVLKKSFEFDFFAFCDSDDIWEKNWVSKLLTVGNNYDLLYSNGYEFIENNSIKKNINIANSSLERRKYDAFSTNVYLQSSLFSKKLLRKLGKKFIDANLTVHYDIDLFIKLKRLNINYIHISDRLFYYRIHEKSLSSNFKKSFKERLYITKKYKFPLIIFFAKSLFYKLGLMRFLNI